ncbi:MAG: MerR family transcriptional regulator [Lachnospiraceae bacterium]|nr:MerR family transcriptional regulator [Lachnospiraceae bacterium]
MYTIGQLAEIAGISPKALRLYEKKGLLRPKRGSTNQYRLYDEEAKTVLQKIMMLRFLGFSLEQIKEFLEENQDTGLEKSFVEQRRLLEQKKKQLETVISCMDKAIWECRENRLDMDELMKSMKDILKNRHADEMVWELTKYSDKAADWNCFVFDEADVQPGQRILDAGAGWGGLWRKNWERIPENVAVTCIDRHNTWADTFEADIKEMEEKGQQPIGRFSFCFGDMEQMELGSGYDRIFFNHTASFMKEGEKMLHRFSDSLNPDGVFICTWGGGMVYEQLAEWFREYGEGIREIEKVENKFFTWIREWEEWLNHVFSQVEKKLYNIELIFEQPEDCLSFILQLSRGLESVLEKDKRGFLAFLQEKADSGGRIRLKKDTCLYRCQKKSED